MAKHLVTYTGAGTRIITKSDWDSLGIEHDTIRWESLAPGHQPSVEIENMSDEMMEYLTKVDTTGFKVREATERNVRSAQLEDERNGATPDLTEQPTTEGDASGTKAAPTTPRGTRR